MQSPVNFRISSISYFGNCTSGKLLAGEAENGSTDLAAPDMWYFPDPVYDVLRQLALHGKKHPNLLPVERTPAMLMLEVVWSSDGSKAFAGTSSANLAAQGGLMVT